jgi:hypothetical protein
MRIAGTVWLTLLVLVSGCGLDDYERRIDKQRARLRVFDEENKYLGDMLEPPGRPSSDTSGPFPFDIFLRLPRGIAGIAADPTGTRATTDPKVYRCSGPDGFDLFLAAAIAGPRDPKDVNKGEWTPANFQDDFRLALGTMLMKYYRQPEMIQRVARPATSPIGEKLPDVVFDHFVLADDPAVRDATCLNVYVHQKGPRLVGLAFQFPQTAREEKMVQQGIDFSLKSLDIGENARAKRAAFAAFKRLD